MPLIDLIFLHISFEGVLWLMVSTYEWKDSVRFCLIVYLTFALAFFQSLRLLGVGFFHSLFLAVRLLPTSSLHWLSHPEKCLLSGRLPDVLPIASIAALFMFSVMN